jgi:transposase
MTVTTMSRKELARLQTLVDLADGRMPVEDAAALIGVGRRQAYRLLGAFRTEGADGLISRRRGRPSNRAHGSVFRQTVLGLVREHYPDFGPTLAVEKLAELHGLSIGVETLRQWMVAEGLWVRRRDRGKRVHQPRSCRDCLGELVQVDGCEHHWFEDRGGPCTLLVFVDDVTSRLMHLRFAPSESAFAYFQAACEYLEAHGKPIAFYKTDAAGGDGMTQFGRAMHELNIDILCANAPQAKGRVERAHKTLQDRLVKELRLAGISDPERGNAWLPGFVAAYNARFGKPARVGKDMHRSLAPQDNLSESFAWQVDRTVTHSLTVQYDRVMFLLEPSDVTRALPRKKVTVYDFPDGRIEVRYGGMSLPYRTFDRITRAAQGEVVENKRLTEALEQCRALQAQMPPKTRSTRAPRRTAQADHMFGIT